MKPVSTEDVRGRVARVLHADAELRVVFEEKEFPLIATTPSALIIVWFFFILNLILNIHIKYMGE